MALTLLPGPVLPSAGAAPVLRVIQGGLSAAGGAAGAGGVVRAAGAVAAAGAVGTVVGPALAVLGAFALGYAIGEGLLALWNLLNQAQQTITTPSEPGYVGDWPLPNPGQTISYTYEWWAAPIFSDTVQRMFESQSVGGKPYLENVKGDHYGPWGGIADVVNAQGSRTQQAKIPGSFRIKAVSTSDGLPPRPNTSTSGNSIDRSPLLNLLEAGAAPSLPITPAAPIPLPVKPADPLPPREDPKLPPRPGTPAPTPATPQPETIPGQPGTPAKPGELPSVTPGPGQVPSTPVKPGEFPTVDPTRPPVPVTPPGTLPVTPAVPVIPTNPDLVNEGGLVVGDPSQRPRPDLDSIAKELGRQEQKLAGLLSGFGVPEALLELLKLLTSADPGTTYSIHPPCGTAPGGGPLPPVEVLVPPTLGDTNAIVARLDALALLIDEHKAMRGLICKGAPTGRPVTVTFVEVDQ